MKSITIFKNLQTLFKTYPILGTIFGVSGAGLITFWIKDVPLKIFSFIKREITTTVDIEPNTYISRIIPLWLERNILNLRKFRKYIISSNSYDSHSIMPYDKFIIKYKRKLMFLSIYNSEIKNNQDAVTKLGVTITILGRHRSIIDELMNEIIETYEMEYTSSSKKPYVYRLTPYGELFKISPVPHRDMKTIITANDVHYKMLKEIDKFENNREWYDTFGIPYKKTFLLYGPPGTGKSSIIKAIANASNRNIITVSGSDIVGLTKINNPSMIKNSVIVLEDVDTINITNNRDTDIKNNPNNTIDINDISLITLSDLLNLMDGLNTIDSMIMIFTTNYIEKLDPALIRPGRMDHLMEVGYLGNEEIIKYIKLHYPNTSNKYIEKIRNMKVKNNITGAKLQEIVINDKPIENIIELCEDEDKERHLYSIKSIQK